MQDKQLSGILLEHVSFFVEIKKKKKQQVSVKISTYPHSMQAICFLFPLFFFLRRLRQFFLPPPLPLSPQRLGISHLILFTKKKKKNIAKRGRQ